MERLLNNWYDQKSEENFDVCAKFYGILCSYANTEAAVRCSVKKLFLEILQN